MAKYIDAEALKEGIACHYQPTDQKYENDRQWAVGYNAGLERALYSLAYAPAADVAPVAWISVKDRLPEEHDSIFATRYREGMQLEGMYRKVSDEVLVHGCYPDGVKFTTHGKTRDGEWGFTSLFQMTVTHWMPLPEPPKEADLPEGRDYERIETSQISRG